MNLQDPLRIVLPGDAPALSAARENAIIDTVRKFRQQSAPPARALPSRDATQGIVILVKNASGEDRNRFDVLGIDGPLFGPNDNLQEFKNNPALRGVEPTTDHAGKFVILQESLPAGKIGHAAIAGATIARVRMQAASDTQAGAGSGSSDELESRSDGTATILWAETLSSYPGTAWALVRLSGGGGGGTGARWFALVTVEAGLLEGQMLRWNSETSEWDSDGPVVEVYPMPGCTPANYLGLEFEGDNYAASEFVPVQGTFEPSRGWIVTVPITPDGYVIPNDADTGG